MPRFSLLVPNRIFSQEDVDQGTVFVELVNVNHLIVGGRSDTLWFEVFDGFGNFKKVKLPIFWNVIELDTPSLVNFVCEGDNLKLNIGCSVQGGLDFNSLAGTFISVSVDNVSSIIGRNKFIMPKSKQISFNPEKLSHEIEIGISEKATQGTGDKFIFLDLHTPENAVLNKIRSRASIRVLENCEEKSGYYRILEDSLRTRDGENYLRDNDGRLSGAVSIKSLTLHGESVRNGLVDTIRGRFDIRLRSNFVIEQENFLFGFFFYLSIPMF